MRAWLAFASALFASALFAASPVTRGDARESFDMVVPAPPTPVTIDGQEWLIYELHLTNFSREALRVTGVDVLAGEGGEADESPAAHEANNVHSFNDAALATRMAQSVRPGERAILYLEVAVDGRRLPRTIRHRVRYVAVDSRVDADVIGAETSVRTKARLALGPPLDGGPWAAVYAWEWPRGHRRVYYTLEGRARLPGRFAIDWVRKDAQGQSARGDADVVRHSLGYGADVLAVANARVAAVRDGIAESDRVSANPAHPLDEKAGNYVALDLGDGRFAIYEHLAPGSIRVARGDRVRRGQVIAALGFTGDSTEPHLHFHVADDPSPLAGEGLPFEFERFRVEGSNGKETRKRERPAPNATVSFD